MRLRHRRSRARFTSRSRGQSFPKSIRSRRMVGISVSACGRRWRSTIQNRSHNMTTDIIESTPYPVARLEDHRAPAEIIKEAEERATAVANVVQKRHLFQAISGKKHVQVEGWSLLAKFYG